MSKKIFQLIEGSSQIKGVRHDLSTSTMLVKFHNDRVYSYNPVTFKEYNDLLSAESVGSHFYKNFKSNKDLTVKEIKDGSKNQ